MKNLNKLVDLITRLEALDGPCRETDAMIAVATWDKKTKGFGWAETVRTQKFNDYPDTLVSLGCYWAIGNDKTESLRTLPTYTASLDAAIPLCEKILGEGHRIKITGFGDTWEVVVMSLYDYYNARHKHVAIALLIATFKVKALEEKG